MAFAALFDACVLYPAPVRDLLLSLARTGLFRARWSADIEAEWIGACLRDRPELSGKLDRTRATMRLAIPDCLVTGYEGLVPHLDLPDSGDRHVLAAAIIGRADVIVTANLRDFPADVLSAYRIEAQHPDVFVRHVLDLDEATAIEAIRHQRGRLNKPAVSTEGFLQTLAKHRLPMTVEFLRARVARL